MMVGRDRELKILTKLAASDQPRVALIAGEPGIGKTRLINELRVGHTEPGSLSCHGQFTRTDLRLGLTTRHRTAPNQGTIATSGRGAQRR
jgi:predicted ATPase